MSKIGIVVPVLNYFQGISDMLLSLQTKHDYKVYVQPQYRYQLPLSSAWNKGIVLALRDGCDYVLVVNDDIMFAPFTVDNLVSEYEKHQKDGCVMMTACNIKGQIANPYDILSYAEVPAEHSVSEHPDFSCFLITKEYLNVVGYFDKNFTPAWFEDNDSHYRVNLAGKKALCSTKCPIYHFGSQTAKLMKEAKTDVSRTYFIQKWGGMPGEETYTTPYNNPDLTLKDFNE